MATRKKVAAPAKRAKAKAKVRTTLTPKQERFVQEYLIDLNATQAAIRSGYSAKTADKIGSQLLGKTGVALAVAAAQQERGERTKVTADEVLREIQRMAMFDPADLTNVKGPEDIRKLPEHVRRAIVGWSWDRQGRFTIKLVKESAVEMLARHHGLFKQDNEQGGAAAGNAIAALLGQMKRSALPVVPQADE